MVLRLFSSHRKTNSQARCEWLCRVKIDYQALWLDEITLSELAPSEFEFAMSGKEPLLSKIRKTESNWLEFPSLIFRSSLLVVQWLDHSAWSFMMASRMIKSSISNLLYIDTFFFLFFLKPDDRAYSNLCKATMLSIAYAANVGGTATLTGTGTNLVFVGQTEE